MFESSECIKPTLVNIARTYPVFHSLLSVLKHFYFPLNEMLVHCRVTLSIKFAGAHLDNWVDRAVDVGYERRLLIK